ncbi:putative signal transducing protein [Burkholderia cepacia]|uniref:putative signal transducing protein n=1 Tax=Burkholderia cepacia TaxID=292 RepID=UPI003B53A6BF
MRFKAPDLATAQHWANVLQVAGIGCELHNCYATGALGGLPADACTPELWLADERDDALARRLLDAASHRPSAGAAPWRCRQCGEALEAQFTACWQCGAVRDPRDD